MRNRIARTMVVLAAALAGGALAVALVTVSGGGPALAGADPLVALSITIDGNHFVNGSGQTIRLLGVDRPGTEYACQQGWGDSDGDDSADAAAADAATIASWRTNAVRVPLNEDCWLGINSQPSYLTALNYQQVVEQFVADLNSDGIYAILDLHWSAPGSNVADGQRPMPDDHSAAFWTSVATAFKTNPAVLFDAFNEPYSPAADYPVDAASYPLSWSCWQSGGCTLPVTADRTDPGADPQTYTAVGMQALVNAIRGTGASQPILLGGLAYANDLSGWITHEPTDPDHQLSASFHNYEGEACSTLNCWNDQVAPVAARVPVVTGEFDQDQCPAAEDGFDQSYMDWADEIGVSYLAWGWFVPVTTCDYRLIDSSGAPVAPNGTTLHDHLKALASAQTTTTSTTMTSTTSSPSTTIQAPATPTTSTTAPGVTTPPASPGTTNAVSEQPLRPCVVPRLNGDHLSSARDRLAAAHCRVGRISGRRGRRSVIATQRPRAGTRGRHDLPVSLTLKVRLHRPATAQPGHAHRR